MIQNTGENVFNKSKNISLAVQVVQSSVVPSQ